MKQKQIYMKLLALTVVFLLTLAQLLTLSFAEDESSFETALSDDGVATDDKPILSVDYLGISTEYEGPKNKQNVPTMESANVTFWVGVSVDKLDQVDFIKNHGLYSLEIGFDYNPTYVEPWGDLEEYSDLKVSSPELTKTEAWLKTLEKFNFSETADNQDENIWNSDLYELVQNDSVRAAGVDADPWREEVVPENWKMGFVSIRKKDTAEKSEATNRFYGAADAGGKYILKMPFRLKAIPQDGSKPLVFKLSRGPSTLSMGAGANGYEDFAAWEKEDRSEPEHNLKNIFTFGGDLNIFGGSSEAGAMSGLTVLRTVDGAEEELDLHTDSTLDTVVTYTPERLEYYVQVPAKTGEVTLTMLGLSEAPTVTYSDNDATTNTLAVSASAGGYTANVALVDVDMSKNDGFNNTVTIKVGETNYLVHIRQLVEARIELAYGNSPVGMIMGNDEKYADEAAKTTAIDAFKETRVFGDVTADRIYNAEAWSSYAEFIDNGDGTKSAYDGDLDPYSVFLFQRRGFMDVGFRAINSLGEEVEATDVTRTMNVIAYKGGIPTYNDTTDMVENVSIVVNQAENYIINDILTYDIRPDVYTMTYKFTDPIVGEITPVKRNYIVISRIGDAIIDANNVVNPNDGNSIVTGYRAMMDANSLYAFRICDALPDANNIVNANDGKTVVTSYSKLEQFYRYLE